MSHLSFVLWYRGCTQKSEQDGESYEVQDSGYRQLFKNIELYE